MPTLLIQAKKHLVDAQKRLEVLRDNRETDAQELATAEERQREAVKTRAGISAVAETKRFTDAARAMLEATEEELAALTEQLPDLERALDREQLMAALAEAAGEGGAAAGELHAALQALGELLPEPRARVMAAHMAVAAAKARYLALGRELVFGYENGQLRWDSNSRGRREAEAELRRRGYDLRAVTTETEPEAERSALVVYRDDVSQHRAAVAKQEEAKRQEAERARSRKIEEREAMLETALLTFPAKYADRVTQALQTGGVMIRAAETFEFREAGQFKPQELTKLAIPQPELGRVRGLLYDALSKEAVFNDFRFENAPYTN